jgi:hypothetical protein|tara:strand:- start:191 stop:310 length:120 start_codon:yes stop_codon:yes gene_type:complete
MDELTVRQAIGAGSGIEALNPKAAENPFAIPTVPEGEHP